VVGNIVVIKVKSVGTDWVSNNVEYSIVIVESTVTVGIEVVPVEELVGLVAGIGVVELSESVWSNTYIWSYKTLEQNPYKLFSNDLHTIS